MPEGPITVRDARAEDEPFLLVMLHYASHSHDEPGRVPADLLAVPTLARYVVGYPREGDVGVVAEDERGPIGAAWARLLAGDERGYGWVDDATPEIAIAVAPEATGRGVGTILMRALLERARGRYAKICLSVRSDNPARRLYARFGFTTVEDVVNRVGGRSETMVLALDR